MSSRSLRTAASLPTKLPSFPRMRAQIQNGDDETTKMIEPCDSQSVGSSCRKRKCTSPKAQLKRGALSRAVVSSPLLLHMAVLRKFHLKVIFSAAVVILLCFISPIRRNIQESRTPSTLPLPSVALRNMLSYHLPSRSNNSKSQPVLGSQAESTTDQHTTTSWPSVAYFDILPSIDDPRWPPIPDANTPHTTPPTIATCVPGMAEDVYHPDRVSQFLLANQKQELQANELIFLFSNVQEIVDSIVRDEVYDSFPSAPATAGVTGDSWCRDVHAFFQDFHPNVKLLCIGERVTAGLARDTLARVATSEVLAFVDPDDQEEPDRNKVIQAMFGCYPGMKLLLHSNYGTGTSFLRTRYHPYDRLSSTLALRAAEDAASKNSGVATIHQPQCPDQQEGVEVIRGEGLHEMVENSHEAFKFGIRSIGGMRPGHMVVRRDVTRYVRSTSLYKGQDTLWVRDIITRFGARDDTAIFLNRPLTTYYQSSHSFKVNVLTSSNGSSPSSSTPVSASEST